VEVKNDGDIVKCIFDVETENPTKVHDEPHSAGITDLIIGLSSPIPGDHILSVYVAGDLEFKRTITLTELASETE
jgi:hypothetical protein